jgi:hypothetical protein
MSVVQDILGVKVTSKPLPFEQSEDLIPDVLEIVGTVLSKLGTGSISQLFEIDTSRLGEMLVGAAATLGHGRLKRIAPLLLATTSVALPDLTGAIERKELGKSADRLAVFNERPDLYFPILLFAGRVNFTRFFPSGWLSMLPGGPTSGAAVQPGASTPSASS